MAASRPLLCAESARRGAAVLQGDLLTDPTLNVWARDVVVTELSRPRLMASVVREARREGIDDVGEIDESGHIVVRDVAYDTPSGRRSGMRDGCERLALLARGHSNWSAFTA